MPVLKGRPRLLDTMLRPVLRVPQVLFALLGCGILWWLEQWWLLPLPLLIAVVAYEWFFWRRADRAIRVELDDEGLTVIDPLKDHRMRVSIADVRTASLRYRPEADRWNAWLVLGGDEGPLFAARMELRQPVWRDEDVDLDAMAAIMGGNAGALWALAPGDRLARQLLEDPNGELIRWAREHLAPAFERVGLRLWQGRVPELDLLGLHTGEPSGWLVLDGDLRLGDERWQPQLTAGRSSRQVLLMQLPGEPGQGTTLPLLVLGTGAHTLAIPAPLAGELGEEVDLDDSALHAHLAEAAALLWYLLRTRSVDELPESLVEATLDARVVLGELPEPLAHLDNGEE